MATKANSKIGANVLTPALTKLSTELAEGFIIGQDLWPSTFTKLVALSIKGEVSTENANAGVKGEKTIDDDVSRMVADMMKRVTAANRPGVKLKKESVESKRSDLRVAVNLGKLDKSHGINGTAVIADAIAEHGKLGDNGKEMLPMLCAVGREAIKIANAHKRRITRDEIVPLVGKPPKADRDASDVWASAAKALDALYTETATLKDGFDGHKDRLALALLVKAAAKEVVSARDIARDAKALADKRAAAPKASLASELAAYGKAMAATAAKRPTKRGK